MIVIPGQFHPKKCYDQPFFHEKKKISQNGRFCDFEIEAETPFGDRKFFLSKFDLVLHFFGVKFTGNYYVVGIIP